MFWANSDGVWVSTGGQPQNISGEVIDFFRNSSDPTAWFAEIVDEQYCIYLGSVTVNGYTYSNCELRFNIPISTWEWRTFYESMAIYARYISSGKQRRYMGDTTGTVWNKGKYTDSTLVSADSQTTAGTGGNPINATFELAPVFFDVAQTNGSINPLSDVKNIRNIIAYAERAQGVALSARAVDRYTRILTPYMPLGKLTEYVNTFQTKVKDGVLLQIQGNEYSTAPYFSFYGFALDIDKHGAVPKPTYL